jgi:hypothetical protein
MFRAACKLLHITLTRHLHRSTHQLGIKEQYNVAAAIMEVGRDQGGRTPRDKERSTRTHRPAHLDRNSMPTHARTHIASSATYTRCEAKVSAIVHGLQVERPWSIESVHYAVACSCSCSVWIWSVDYYYDLACNASGHPIPVQKAGGSAQLRRASRGISL